MIHYTGTKYGEVVIRQGATKYTIQIREGNCLAVFIHVMRNPNSTGKQDKYIHTFYTFFCDVAHAKRVMKEYGKLFGSEEIVKCRLNIYHKNALTLSRLMAQSGYKVEVYYDDGKKATRK